MQAPVTPVRIETVEDQHRLAKDDLLVTEEPLEIRLGHGPTDDRSEVRLSVTMRTPGQDEDLVRGFLFTEAIIAIAQTKNPPASLPTIETSGAAVLSVKPPRRMMKNRKISPLTGCPFSTCPEPGSTVAAARTSLGSTGLDTLWLLVLH